MINVLSKRNEDDHDGDDDNGGFLQLRKLPHEGMSSKLKSELCALLYLLSYGFKGASTTLPTCAFLP
jgi:hypothetical protein